MKKTTLIEQAYNSYARKYEEYHEKCQHMPIKVKPPRISYLGYRGFEINGRVHRQSASDIIFQLRAAEADCARLINDSCEPTKPSVYERFVNSEPIYEVHPLEGIAEQTLVSV